MSEFDYYELTRMIDLRIADALERIVETLEFEDYRTVLDLKDEIEWLRTP